MSDCCPHPVERHAYNGCANCGCAVPWTEHPERDFDTSDAGLQQNKNYRDRLTAENKALTTRIEELLSTIVRLTNETPFADEAKDALEQRGKLVAEIGTLRSELAEANTDRQWLRDGNRALIAERDSIKADFERMSAVHSFDEWHEDIGNVLWWMLPVCEPPYCGTPLDDDWPFEDDERPAWTTLIVPALASKETPK